jgi:hypothetical protein
MPSHKKHGSASEEALPPSEVRFTELRVEPWPDGRRVRVLITLTPFQQNPSLEAVLSDALHQPLSSTSIIETADDRLVFTMHLRPAVAGVPYHLTASILYPEIGMVDERSTSFEVQPAAGEEI